MTLDEIAAIAQRSRTMRDAMVRIASEFGDGRIKLLFYGFFVHLHGRDRSDTLVCHTAPDKQEIVDAFLSAGGANTDIVASKLEHIVEPYAIDIVAEADRMRQTRDFRLAYIDKMLSYDVKTAWICPINDPWVGGYGVLNQFYTDRFAEPAIAVSQLRAFAHKFHEEARRHRLLSHEIGLRASQIEILAQVAMGKSADDLADKYKVTARAIEKRLEHIRRRLRARNTLEAIYKATIYGVLPSGGHN
ncbi:transcriptional regulator, LuxR family [Jannaschia sp. CCS1]|nr:transcriptional regulator, LuxR family [Jannaschia sp. CCS1]